jgi:hypothetical protein
MASRGLTAKQRSAISKCLTPHLRDAADPEAAVDAVELAVQRYFSRLEAGIKKRPPASKTTRVELKRLQEAAESVINAVESLSPETRARLREWVDIRSDLGMQHSRHVPLLPPQVLRNTVDLCSQIADGAIFLQRELAWKKLPKGRPPDSAARALAYELSLVWTGFTDQPMTRPRGTTHSPWTDFVCTMFRIAEAGAKGEHYARLLAEKSRPPEKKQPETAP